MAAGELRVCVSGFDPRSTLLAHNAGTWEGSFVRCDGLGAELERFASLLTVRDEQGTIEAALTNRSSGSVRRMAFQQPPAEMQIDPQGHWSLGPDRLGPWPWVCELCLVAGQRRRRAVVRHDATGLASLVLVWEARPGVVDPPPPPPLALAARPLAAAGARRLWQAGPGLEVETMEGPRGGAEQVLLRWWPEGAAPLTIVRAYDRFGSLLPLA